MAGPLFDVFVVGARDPSPVAQMHLAAALANHFRVPVTQVAQALTARNLRAGQALEQQAAQALVQQLAGFGALAELRPALAGRVTMTPPPPTPVGPNPTLVDSRTPSGRVNPFAGSSFTPTPSPVSVTRTPVGRDPFQAPTDTGPLPLPHQLPTGALRTMTSAPPTAVNTLAGPRDPFAPPEEVAPLRLELGGPRTTAAPHEDAPRPSRSLPGASGLTLGRMAADSGESGLELGEGAEKMHSVRCPTHGLYYDKRKASGCRKCLAPAAAVARAIEEERSGGRAGLRRNPAKRAFMGLALALVLGFVPAAVHAFNFGGREVGSLRAEQTLLSKRAGTSEVMRRFDAIEDKVGEAHRRAARNTFAIWLLVSGVVMAGWYKLT